MLSLELENDLGVVNFPVDQVASFIEGIIVADTPESLRWDIQIECEEAEIPIPPEEGDDDAEESYLEDCTLEISGLVFPLHNWRELSGKVAAVSFVADEVHPILPDNPGNFYFDSCHHVPNGNRVEFGAREGTQFAVDWSCVVRAYAEDEGRRVVVKTRLALRQFQVWFREERDLSLDIAKQLVLMYAKPDDIGEPVKRTSQWVVVPVRAEAA